jgi:SOS regulatory protein LexA
MNHTGTLSGRPAGVHDFLTGGRSPASVYDIVDNVEVRVAYRFDFVEANRQCGAWAYRVGNHPALRVEADEVPSGAQLPARIGGTVLLPVHGWITGGPLNLAAQAFESAFLLDQRAAGHGTFMLKVVGHSMRNAGILDGDWVVIHGQSDARDGEIVAAMVDGEVTVKRLHRVRGLVELLPENPDFGPIPATEQSLEILGTVLGVVRQA